MISASMVCFISPAFFSRFIDYDSARRMGLIPPAGSTFSACVESLRYLGKTPYIYCVCSTVRGWWSTYAGTGCSTIANATPHARAFWGGRGGQGGGGIERGVMV